MVARDVLDARGYPRVPEIPTGSVVLEAEAELDADLEVLHPAVVHLAADLGHLEPVHVAQRLAGALDPVADGLVDAVGRGADDLGDAVRAVRHGRSWRSVVNRLDSG